MGESLLMAAWFWYFVLYSFLGFLVEVVFARITHNPKRDRKCLYFLPLCPVYGLGVLLMLALPAARSNSWMLFLWAALSATGAEYLMDLFYDRVLGVSFWDYSHLPLNLSPCHPLGDLPMLGMTNAEVPCSQTSCLQ